jgi:archaemetzincin
LPRRRFLQISAGAAVALAGCNQFADAADDKRKARIAELVAAADKIRPLYTPLGKPRPGDWLESHHEDGQTFREYLATKPITPQGARRTIYFQSIGDFTKVQQQIVDDTAAYLAAGYHREVKTLAAASLKDIPAKARRTPEGGAEQILTDHVLYKVLAPKLPKDAAAMIALTAADLWPGEGWNYVFGQASLRDRVGVWSIHRNGDPAAGDKEYRLCLLRTIRTAAHELGHMFSIQHCTAYECNMCGSNNREESDRRPLAECPQCTAKICWATEDDPQQRFNRLAKYCQDRKLADEQKRFERLAAALADQPAR